MWTAILIDDEQIALDVLEIQLVEIGSVSVAGKFLRVSEAIEQAFSLKPDLIFLDIEMPGTSGLQAAELLIRRCPDAEIIYVTAHHQYAIEAFDTNAIGYLLKPVAKERLVTTLSRFSDLRVKKMKPSNKMVSSRNIRISLFGKLSVYVDDEPKPIRWVTLKCAELFAYMLLHKGDNEVSKWKLIDVLWKEKDMEKADINLRSTVSRINKTLREHDTGLTLGSTRNGYRLECSDRSIEVDAFDLERLVLDVIVIDSSNAEQYEGAVRSYSALMLEEFGGEWCEAVRQTYHRYYLHAVRQLIGYYEDEGHLLKCIDLVERVIEHEPYNDSIRENAMRLICQVDGKKQAMEYYDRYVSLLDNELGTEPHAAMMTFYNELKQGELL